MKAKKVRVYLRPEDMNRPLNGSNYTVRQAVVRTLKTHPSVVCSTFVSTGIGQFKIKDGFTQEDHDFVRSEYARDPHMKKAQYYITLIQV